MTDTEEKETGNAEINQKFRPDEQPETTGRRVGEEPLTDSARFREASYVVLFIAAVFVVNAMETGSYRTPWPVAIITLLAGLGLFGYSWYLRKKG